MNTEVRKNEITQEEKGLALLAHIGAFLGYVIIIGNILVPLLVYIIKGKDSWFVEYHSLESLNFQISMTIYALIAVVTIIGWIFLVPLALFEIIVIILASIRAGNGELFRYPLSIRFIKPSSAE